MEDNTIVKFYYVNPKHISRDIYSNDIKIAKTAKMYTYHAPSQVCKELQRMLVELQKDNTHVYTYEHENFFDLYMAVFDDYLIFKSKQVTDIPTNKHYMYVEPTITNISKYIKALHLYIDIVHENSISIRCQCRKHKSDNYGDIIELKLSRDVDKYQADFINVTDNACNITTSNYSFATYNLIEYIYKIKKIIIEEFGG